LAGSMQPVAWLRLGTGSSSPLTRSDTVPALVSGPVADGGWVSITTDSGPLPVLGPLHATHRWRDLGADIDAHPRVAALADRAPRLGSSLRQVLFVAFGCFILWFSLGQVGPTWNAAHAQGIPGSFTVTSEDCSGKGPCAHYGNFRSSDGRH